MSDITIDTTPCVSGGINSIAVVGNPKPYAVKSEQYIKKRTDFGLDKQHYPLIMSAIFADASSKALTVYNAGYFTYISSKK